ncbi:crustacean hyperglycemic hormones 5 isoform X2 [Prorops nasuta]|uniref:crustacean hyperglycemic hormones 5 isoform X2 n=1 Tax=Prorops nasuta TaxID=863751 RepID=UPI0034CD1DAF
MNYSRDKEGATNKKMMHKLETGQSTSTLSCGNALFTSCGSLTTTTRTSTTATTTRRRTGILGLLPSQLLLNITWTTTLLLLALSCTVCQVNANPQYKPSRLGPFLTASSLSKRSFMDIECKGVYDRSIFARLDRICEDCYNLFREPSLHTLCRQKCFTSEYFPGCVETLQLTEKAEKESIDDAVLKLGGRK